MFTWSEYPALVLRWRQGSVMSGFLTFMDRYRDEAACIAALAELRWPKGFVCPGCARRLAYQLAARPRVFECAGCGRQHSVTAGTVFHRTRTPLRKWFAAAWLMAHKLRHALSERAEYPLDGLLEIDESYYGGRGKPESRGRGLTDPNKSLMAIAVETVPAQAAARPREASSILRGRPPHLPTGSGEWRSPLVAGSSEPG